MSISSGRKVRLSLRIGSALLVTCAAVALFRLFQEDNVSWWGWLISGAILLPWSITFGYAAFFGRAPNWFDYLCGSDD
jgi:hypothetical protein